MTSDENWTPPAESITELLKRVGDWKENHFIGPFSQTLIDDLCLRIIEDEHGRQTQAAAKLQPQAPSVPGPVRTEQPPSGEQETRPAQGDQAQQGPGHPGTPPARRNGWLNFFCISISIHSQYLRPSWRKTIPPSLPSFYVQGLFFRLSITWSKNQQP